MTASLAASLASLTPTERARALDGFTAAELHALEFDWRLWARPEQLPPAGAWIIWLILAGRGFGKTRTGAEWVRAEQESGAASRFAIIGPTAADTRDVMVEGESGILAISPPWNRPIYEPSKRRLTWPNGAVGTLYSADEPDRLRGPQHDRAWCDEVAAWRYPETWDMMTFGLRLGTNPRACATTTPKPVKLVRDLMAHPRVAITRGSTFANRHNLAPSFLQQIVAKYEGTRLGRQELEGELLEDVPGALWTRAILDRLRVRQHDAPESFDRIVVAIDPAVTSGEESDETGIIVAGKAKKDGVAHAYVLRDLSGRMPAIDWARKAVTAYHEHKADRIVAEVNNGGDLVEAQLRVVDRNISYRAVHATKGKRVRAEPVAALYEQGRVHHVGGFAALEDQMCTFAPDQTDQSPDRVDALVWALTSLMLTDGAVPTLAPLHY